MTSATYSSPTRSWPGFPPHIAQVIAGHRDVNVTLGYKNSRELHQMGENPQVA